MTEFGWSRIHWEDNEEIREEGHIIVNEHQMYTNGTYVAENRKVSNLNFLHLLRN